MRIWSVHPKYLDSKGLVALWRETLLAKHVLNGKTQGYKNHPQLNRFKATLSPVDLINAYLAEVYKEATNRAYNFNRDKIDWNFSVVTIEVTSGQLNYEVQHLLQKLEIRDLVLFERLNTLTKWETHPLFKVVPGEVEDWEIVK